MSESSSLREPAADGLPISFGERYFSSSRFQAVYREGMTLVEETAQYLDGDGRGDSRGLTGQLALTYATESMRLTTRLMNLASWLLIRRSVNTGEMSQQKARSERQRLKLDIGRPSHVRDFTGLPNKLRTLIQASFDFQDKIVKLDRLFEDGPVLGVRMPVSVASTTQANSEAVRHAFDSAYRERN
jgi:regulator of CtrA degradation